MNTRVLGNFFQVASLLLLLLAVALMAAIVTMHFAIHGAEVEVPALKDMTVADALSETAGLGLNLDVDNRYYSGDIAAGHIVSQSPAPGTVVRREWHVRVAESLGPQRVDVPDAVGVDERVASLELQRAGLVVGEIAWLPYPSAAEGTVIAQDPPAHAQGIEQPSVNLLVAAPDDQTPDGYVMPDFTGWPITSANAALEKVGIGTGPPSLVNVPIAPVGSDDAPIHPVQKPGEVLTQSPPAGSRIDENTIVHFTVVK